MKITCFIDNLNAGGAQRQICNLAYLLKQKNHEVTILTYQPSKFFLNDLKKKKIKNINIKNKINFIKLMKILKFFRNSKNEIVLAYLRMPSLIALISRIFGKKWKLIVSERNNYINENFFKNFFRRIMYLFSDHIIVNSNTGYKSIKKNIPWIKDISVIYNYVDLDYFKPIQTISKRDKLKIDLIGVGKYSDQKNIINLVKALKIIKEELPYMNLNIQWFGDNFSYDNTNTYLNKVRTLINKYNLNETFFLNPATNKILDHYQISSALILPSIYEGFPNVVCEALACGLPVLISDVCDNHLFVDRNNGYLFDPNDPTDIANKIISFIKLESNKKNEMSINSRKKAEYLFDKKNFINSHLKIINSIK